MRGFFFFGRSCFSPSTLAIAVVGILAVVLHGAGPGFPATGFATTALGTRGCSSGFVTAVFGTTLGFAVVVGLIVAVLLTLAVLLVLLVLAVL